MVGARSFLQPVAFVRCLALGLICGLLAACAGAPTPTPVPVIETPCLVELHLKSLPSGADVSLGGKQIGRTPFGLSLPPGAYHLTLQRQGYAAHRVEVLLRCGERQSLAPTLLDVAPPIVALAALPAYAAPEEGLPVAAQAADNAGVASMTLYINDLPLHSAPGPSLRFRVDTRALGAGIHRGRIVACDAAGNEAATTFEFEVVIPTPQPATPTAAAMTAPPPTTTPTREPARPTLAIATPQPSVAVFQDQISLLMYDYEGALYTDPERAGHPYPLLDHDRVGPPITRTYRTIVLRNEYLEVVLLPELGGRIYQIRFLPTGQPLLYNSRVAKPTRWGPTDQGWWLALGGIEFALPVDEHGYLTAQPWDAAVIRGADGSATVTVQIVEQTRQIEARIEITLRPREAAVRLRTTLRNQSNRSQSFQYWVNAMLSPGQHGVGSKLRFTLPADSVIVHSTGDNVLPPPESSMPWPHVAGRDLSRYENWQNWLGVFAPELAAPFAAVYDEATQIGIVHASAPETMRGTKLFGFGRDFDHSVYADDGAQYVELWGGLTPTFWQYTSLAAGEQVRWDDTWYVVAGVGGVDFANAESLLYAERDGQRLHLNVASPGEHLWRLVVSQSGQTLLEERMAVRPDAPHRVALDLRNLGERVNVHILRSDGSTVLQYDVAP